MVVTAENAVLASTKAVGLACCQYLQLAIMSIRLAMNLTSSPPAIILANQHTAALGSLPRIDFIKAETMS